jgi:hypothetical protein
MKFAPGDLVRNVRTSEDGKVIEAYQDKGATMYMVSVPKDSAGWILGARIAYWSGDNLDSSTNESLREENSTSY